MPAGTVLSKFVRSPAESRVTNLPASGASQELLCAYIGAIRRDFVDLRWMPMKEGPVRLVDQSAHLRRMNGLEGG